MAQILDLSKRFTQEQIEEAAANSNQYNDIVAGGYVCKIVEAILHDDEATGKHNIELHLDIEEGDYKGYFQSLEDRAGFWGLRGYMSFKESQIDKFLKTCTAVNVSNPGYSFDPMRAGGADVDSLNGKLIGAVIQKEEYKANNGDIREKCTVYNITEVKKIRDKKYKIPSLKKLEADSEKSNFVDVPSGDNDYIPFD